MTSFGSWTSSSFGTIIRLSPARPISALPTISLVTPSYQQAPFLEATLRSVLEQRYPALQYVVMDGGSTDGSVAIIEKHAAQLHAWTSGSDGGQYAAVAAGFARTDGEVLGWLNSDDMHCPWTLAVVGEIFARFPEVEWLTTARPLFWDRLGRAVHGSVVPGYTCESFRRGEHLPRAGGFALGYIQQESTFWRRSLWERSGGFDAAYPLAGDFALWARFFQHAELYAVETPLAGFRVHGDQKTAHQTERYADEAERAFLAYDGVHGGGTSREMARRAPASLWPLLAKAGQLFEAPLVVFDRARGEWKIERRFV